mgnify:CR=1 FL=1
MSYVNCKLCPRECGIDRTQGEMGYCRCPDTAMVAKTMLHKWEEPALAGNGGSGAVFFGGCTLRCSYCQNAAISGGPVGRAVDSAGLRGIFEDLIARGAENIDLVTRHGIFNETEFRARHSIYLEAYNKIVAIEARTMIDMAMHQILPAALHYSRDLCAGVEKKNLLGISARAERGLLTALSQQTDALYDSIEALKLAGIDMSKPEPIRAAMKVFKETLEKFKAALN